VRDVVVPLDVIEIHRPGDARCLIQVAEVALQIRIVDDPPEVAFEVPVIDRIEAHEGAEKPPVRFDECCAKQISSGREP
jgi:hypothetical protein